MFPTLSVVAGPNGSGKSTLTSSIWFEGNSNLIDPDAIARSIDPVEPSRAAIPAARQAILRCKALLAARVSFTLETPLAGHGAITIMKEARKYGEPVDTVKADCFPQLTRSQIYDCLAYYENHRGEID